MKVTSFVLTFLVIVGVAQATGSQSSVDQVGIDTHATPAPTTNSDGELPTPKPTTVDDLVVTPAPTFPTAAPTASADLLVTPAPTTTSDGSSSSESDVSQVSTAVGVAYSTTLEEEEAASKSYTVPIAVAACVAGLIAAVAAAFVIRKRKIARTDSTLDEDYTHAIATPV
ncbi:hypothetical protein PHYBOEH_000617 [Phytophthora boehmeriae]|uniref:Uncharacterized protein n=1 Tax=Phytophthora boehmeriae TaxID=109152 RepID=A0A8T1XCX5_9STRA|nr:hypothetical protein PHYBOEH_000617 [Phytophthora boehmeriae]